MSHEKPLSLSTEAITLRVPSELPHVTEEGVIRLNDGDYAAECFCGEEFGPMPSSEDVVDALMSHARSAGAASVTDRPNLGLATTLELLDEVRARIELDGRLSYRTVDS